MKAFDCTRPDKEKGTDWGLNQSRIKQRSDPRPLRVKIPKNSA